LQATTPTSKCISRRSRCVHASWGYQGTEHRWTASKPPFTKPSWQATRVALVTLDGCHFQP
jgi:hypothetical protein